MARKKTSKRKRARPKTSKRHKQASGKTLKLPPLSADELVGFEGRPDNDSYYEAELRLPTIPHPKSDTVRPILPVRFTQPHKPSQPASSKRSKKIKHKRKRKQKDPQATRTDISAYLDGPRRFIESTAPPKRPKSSVPPHRHRKLASMKRDKWDGRFGMNPEPPTRAKPPRPRPTMTLRNNNDREMDAAATHIQRIHRGKAARKAARKKVEKEMRMLTLAEEEAHKQATRIQRLHRGNLARNEQLSSRAAATAIQRVHRGNVARGETKRRDIGITTSNTHTSMKLRLQKAQAGMEEKMRVRRQKNEEKAAMATALAAQVAAAAANGIRTVSLAPRQKDCVLLRRGGKIGGSFGFVEIMDYKAALEVRCMKLTGQGVEMMGAALIPLPVDCDETLKQEKAQLAFGLLTASVASQSSQDILKSVIQFLGPTEGIYQL